MSSLVALRERDGLPVVSSFPPYFLMDLFSLSTGASVRALKLKKKNI